MSSHHVIFVSGEEARGTETSLRTDHGICTITPSFPPDCVEDMVWVHEESRSKQHGSVKLPESGGSRE